ncbi:MAG: ester cyclase [Burkholderiales bacterium]|nr:ester cyclase [Burkholderiales bacterium]
MFNEATQLASKDWVRSTMGSLVQGGAAAAPELLAQAYHPDAEWRGSHPWNEVQGVAAIAQVFWQPLLHAFPDLERREQLLIGGQYQGRDYVGAVGHLCGRFQQAWMGLPATGQLLYLRYGEFHQLVDGRIVQSTVLLDVLDAVRQMGFWPLPTSPGCEGMWAGPLAGDGLVLTAQDPAQSAASLALSLAMQASLGAYDDTLNLGREGLLAMPQREFWHPHMMWFGPSGIGTSRGLDGFVDVHQLPFRTAFPRDPKLPQPAGMGQHGGSHYVRIGDGRFSATGGWPSRHMLHQGGGWLGLPPTGRAITMRVMDFYSAEQGLIRENWVPIDLINVLLQLDIDVLARARSQLARRG